MSDTQDLDQLDALASAVIAAEAAFNASTGDMEDEAHSELVDALTDARRIYRTTLTPAVLRSLIARVRAAPDMEAVIGDCLGVCSARGWSLHWTARGAYLHLEASELIEAWRGKGESTVAEEAGDVLLVLFSILGASNVPWADALSAARSKITDLQTRPRYAGEEYSAHLSIAATPSPTERGAPSPEPHP